MTESYLYKNEVRQSGRTTKMLEALAEHIEEGAPRAIVLCYNRRECDRLMRLVCDMLKDRGLKMCRVGAFEMQCEGSIITFISYLGNKSRFEMIEEAWTGSVFIDHAVAEEEYVRHDRNQGLGDFPQDSSGYL